MEDSRQWWLHGPNGQDGPLALEEIRERISAGTATPSMLVWREGFESWKPLGQIFEFPDGTAHVLRAAERRIPDISREPAENRGFGKHRAESRIQRFLRTATLLGAVSGLGLVAGYLTADEPNRAAADMTTASAAESRAPVSDGLGESDPRALAARLVRDRLVAPEAQSAPTITYRDANGDREEFSGASPGRAPADNAAADRSKPTDRARGPGSRTSRNFTPEEIIAAIEKENPEAARMIREARRQGGFRKSPHGDAVPTLAGTPTESELDRMVDEAVAKLERDPGYAEALASPEFSRTGISPAEFEAHVRVELRKVIKEIFASGMYDLRGVEESGR